MAAGCRGRLGDNEDFSYDPPFSVTGRNKLPIQELRDVIGHLPTYDRTSINSWEDTEFKEAVKALRHRKLIMTAF